MSEGWKHIEINDHGTIAVLGPISDEGRDWFAEHVGEPEPGGIYTFDRHVPAARLAGVAEPAVDALHGQPALLRK